MLGTNFHHQSWMLHPSTHLREIWTTFGKTWALKASFSAHHHSRFKITTGSESSIYWSWVVTWKKKKKRCITRKLIMHEFHTLLTQVRRHLQTAISWIPGHSGIFFSEWVESLEWDIFTRRLDKFWQHQDILHDYKVELTGVGNRSHINVDDNIVI